MGENRQGGHDRNNPSSTDRQGQPHERQDQQRRGSVDRQQNQQKGQQGQQERRDKADHNENNRNPSRDPKAR